MTPPSEVPVGRGVPDPQPVPASLERHLTETLARIPSGRTGVLTAAVSTIGAEAAIGVRKTTPKVEFTVSGWTGLEWGGRGWIAGARGSIVW